MKRYIWITGWMILGALSGQAQDMESWMGALRDHGFQNIRILGAGDGVQRVDLENRRYRFTSFGFSRLLADMPIGSDTVHFILRERDLPMARVTVARGQVIAMDWADTWLDADVTGAERREKSFFQFDLPVGIGIRYQLGDFNDPVDLALDLVPGLDVTLAPGLSLQAGVAIPLTNDLDAKTKIRLNHAMVVQDLRLPERMLLSISAGFFSDHRAGIHGQWRKYLWGERIAIGMDAGYTVFSEVTGPERFPYQKDRPAPYYTFRADYLWKKYHMLFELHAGQFLYGDAGVVGRAFRQFGETRVGVELVWTDLGKNGGFFFRIPLVPRRYGRPSAVRITADPWFEIPYRYIGGDRAGRFYRYGRTLVDGAWEYFPTSLRSHLTPAVP